MKAMKLERLGPGVPFEAVDLERRPPGGGEVAIKIHATSVNVVDAKMRNGSGAIAPEAPIVLGCDVAGTIEAVGPGVTGFKIGDAVYGCAGGVKGRDGAYAEYMIADARLIAPKPKTLSFREAAAMPLVAITAWEALVDRANVQPGELVLVHGATGGVGHVGVQLAKALGATVHTTVSSDQKAEVARNLGADEIINYRTESVESYVARATSGEGYAVVFDTVGGDNITPSLNALAVNGRCVSIVSRDATPSLSPLHFKNASLHVVFMLIPMLTGRGLEAHGHILRRLAAMIDHGRIAPLLDQSRFTLDEIGAAHAHLSSGQAIGKVVIDVAT